MRDERSTLRRPWVSMCLTLALVAIAAGILPSRAADGEPSDGTPIGRSYRDAAPVSIAPLNALGMVESSTNIDFASKALLGFMGDVAHNDTANHLYTGNRRVFSVYNVVVPSSPGLVGRLEIPQSTFSGGIISVEYPGSGNYVYVTVDADGLYSIDVSDPTAPVIAGSYTGQGSGALAVDGTRAYIATQPRDVHVVDISTPTTPTFLGKYTQLSGLTGDIWASGDYAYVVAQNGLFDPLGIWVIDATNPAAPVKVNDLRLFTQVSGVGGEGNRLYVTASDSGLVAYDITAPASPVFLGFGASGLGSGLDVVPDGGVAYVATGAGLDIISVSTPSSMFELGSTTDIPGYATTTGLSLGPTGYVFLSAFRGGLQVADVSPAASVQIVASIESPGDLRDVAVSGPYAFYLASTQGMFITDNSIVDRPRLVGIFESLAGADAVHVAGDLAFYSEISRLKIIDVSNPSSPTQIGEHPANAEGLDVVGTLAYLAESVQGLTVVDISDPTTPIEIGSAPISSSARAVKVVDDVAYVANWNDGLTIFDVSDPTNPTEIGSFDTPGVTVDIDVVGRYAYIADESSRLLLIVDVIDPTNPSFTGQYVCPGSVVDVVVVGDLAYVAASASGLRVVDVSTPWAPVEVGSYETDDPFFGVAFQGGYALTAENHGGASILHFAGQCFDDFEPNDQFADAYAIIDGVSYPPKICDQGDVDYFSITPPSGGTLDITMQPPPGKDYSLFLHDAQQNLIAASLTAGDATETIVRTVGDTGPYFVKVTGNVGEFDSSLFYNLFYLFEPCPVPVQPVYISTINLDENFNSVLDVQDPNQPENVTGYNLYRSASPIGPFDLIGANLTDFDDGRPNIQLVDVDSASCGPLCFYKVTAFNGVCNAEGPQ